MPGFVLVRKLKPASFEILPLSLVVGFSFFGFILYLFRLVNLPFYFAELTLLLFCFFHLRDLKPAWSNIRFIPPPSFLIIACTSALIHSAVLVQSALPVSGGLQFVNLSFHDSMQHLSIITRLHQSSRIDHPGFSDALLTNYHYLIDQILAAFTRFSYVSLFHVYYRFYPIAVSLIFALTIYSFAKSYSKHRFAPHFTLLFVLFSGNLSFYAHYFRGSEFSWGANAFIINPLIDLLQNPASIFVLAQLLVVIQLLIKLKPSVIKKSITHQITNYFLPLALVSGTMIGFKAWGGLLVTISLFAFTFWHLIKFKRIFILILPTLSIVISILLFFPHYNSASAASPIWAPGWTLERLVNDADRWNYLDDIFLKQHYEYTHNLPRLTALYIKWFLIYLVGNFGIKLVGLFSIANWIFLWKKLSSTQVFIITMTFFSLCLPLFFNQGRMAYDIEQFSPYSLLLASIFTILFLLQIFKKLSTPHLFASILILLTIILSAPSNLTSLSARILATTSIIPNQELEDYSKITAQTPPDSVILLTPSHRHIATLEFAALTNRNTFYSGRTLSIITGEDYQTRQKIVEQIFDRLDFHQLDLLIENQQISHLYLDQEDINHYGAIASKYNPIFQSASGALYKF